MQNNKDTPSEENNLARDLSSYAIKNWIDLNNSLNIINLIQTKAKIYTDTFYSKNNKWNT